jgi:hypothetical protein
MQAAHRLGQNGPARAGLRTRAAEPARAPLVWATITLLALASLVAFSPARAQHITALDRVTAFQPAEARKAVPFEVGEKLTYDVKFGALKVGTGRMEVVGTESVRGREAWHTRFTVKGGVPFYKVNDRMESWIDTRTLESLRFVQDLQEGSRDKERHFEIYPDRGTYTEKGEVEHAPSVEDPLDDAAFLYFVRTIPLEVGKTYEFNRYFRPDRNPVKIRVLRTETVKVPAGTFETIVIQPIIKSKGIFSEKGRAEMWLTNDSRRMLVQMKSDLSIGSLNLYLKGYQPGVAAMVDDVAAETEPKD